MVTVLHPPALVAQETGAWSFAAAEVMVRSYRGLPAAPQYEIARRITVTRAGHDPDVQQRLQIAEAMDMSAGQQENGGANLNSEVVQLVRTQWNAFDKSATGGRFVDAALTPHSAKAEIANNRIFVIGNAYHYYVVYGYESDSNTMLLRDPWPQGQGGLTSRMSLASFLQIPQRLVICF